MKTLFFQGKVLDDIKRHLTTGDVPLKRLSSLAEGALTLSDKYGTDISNQDIVRFLADYPEVSRGLMETMENEDSEAREAAVDEIRMLIIKKRS